MCGGRLLLASLTVVHTHTHVHRVMMDHRILIMNDGLDHNVIKVKPPMCFTQDNADTLLQAIDQTLLQLGH